MGIILIFVENKRGSFLFLMLILSEVKLRLDFPCRVRAPQRVRSEFRYGPVGLEPLTGERNRNPFPLLKKNRNKGVRV